ncbi:MULTISPECIES: hypothetical protein [unclassified Clostridium]|jgi:hypothetical protein|uniref:hypothetical protein n=1 Tax=Clostridia TaxID=186801 RepID=UPI00082301D2|nr:MULTISPECIES: hypothetical protein [unclassified Clostridium]SCJ72194.1 Uncharacterised protein [uncultured Clostridium sp.]
MPSKSSVPELPIGFGMSLAQNNEALTYFGSLSPAEKTAVIHYVHDGNTTGEQAKEKIDHAVSVLERHSTLF